MSRPIAVFTGIFVFAVGALAEAQVLGVFRWQSQPFCNVLTLTVAQQGGQFLLTGSDDLCGAGVAPVTGTAVVSGASVAMGMTVSLPSGAGAHLTATLALATVSGPWQDGDGRTGTFQFLAGAGTGGAPRPAPASAAVILSTQLSPTIFAGTGSAATVAHSDHTHDARYAPRLMRSLVSAWRLAFLGSETLGSINGCATSVTSNSTGFVPIDVPSGATVTSLVARVFDGTAGSYTLSWSVDTVQPTASISTPLASANGGGQTVATVTHTLTPASPLTMAPGQTLRLSFATGGSFANGLCSVELNYTLPPAS